MFSQMTTLSERSFAAKMAFAYLVDAHMQFPECNPNECYKVYPDASGKWPIRPWYLRNARHCTDAHGNRYLTADSLYSTMWRRIEKMYESMKYEGDSLSDLSTTEFTNFCQRYTRFGFTWNNHRVETSDVMAKASAWSKRGWFRHEEKQSEDLKKLMGFAKIGAVLGLGIFGIPAI